ncbi:MAG: AMP-binding protein [Acidimicrobiia bacterium]|nr:AMP-binding protein [Acidimicrobiia bacterium]
MPAPLPRQRRAHLGLGAFGLGTQLALGRRFSASRFWDEVRRYGATQFNSLGAMLPILFKQPPRPDDADNPVRLVLSAACPKEIWEPFEQRFGVEIVEFYGTVEGGLTFAGPDAPVGSIGKPLPINEMRVVREDDTDCAPNEIGEIVSRPASGVLVQYYKDEKATAEKTRGGWMRSGDLAYVDEGGWMWFVDRKKDVIRRRGENISSYEVEKILDEHPDILESAAFAVPSDVGEDEVMAALVLQPGATLDPLSVMEHCEERMAYFQIPRYLRVVDSLQKTGTHRAQKNPLREEGVTEDTWDREAAGYELKR